MFKNYENHDPFTAYDANALLQQSIIPFASAAERDAVLLHPTPGTLVYRTDRGWTEQYFSAYDEETNPAGSTLPGWYPVFGAMPSLLGYTKGSTGVPSGAEWIPLNTAVTQGTNVLNDGFTYGPGKIDLPIAGFYWIDATVAFEASSGGNLRGVRVVGSRWVSGNIQETDRATRTGNTVMKKIQGMIAGGTAESPGSFMVQAVQDSGTNLNVNLNYVSAEFRRPLKG